MSVENLKAKAAVIDEIKGKLEGETPSLRQESSTRLSRPTTRWPLRQA